MNEDMSKEIERLRAIAAAVRSVSNPAWAGSRRRRG